MINGKQYREVLPEDDASESDRQLNQIDQDVVNEIASSLPDDYNEPYQAQQAQQAHAENVDSDSEEMNRSLAVPIDLASPSRVQKRDLSPSLSVNGAAASTGVLPAKKARGENKDLALNGPGFDNTKTNFYFRRQDIPQIATMIRGRKKNGVPKIRCQEYNIYGDTKLRVAYSHFVRDGSLISTPYVYLVNGEGDKEFTTKINMDRLLSLRAVIKNIIRDNGDYYRYLQSLESPFSELDSILE